MMPKTSMGIRTNDRRLPRRAWIACAFALSALGGIACGPGTTISVSTTDDDGADGGVSLRSAIDRVNASASQQSHTIELPDGEYALTSCGADDSNDAGDLDIVANVPVTLLAKGPNVVIRQTCPGERVLDVHGSGLLTLVGVTITGGSLVGHSPDAAEGGGVRATGDVKLERTQIRENSATGAAGVVGTADVPAVNGGPAHGGGLFVGGSLHATDASFTANEASGGAEASGSLGAAAEGGGAYVAGAITLSGGSFAENGSTSTFGGGEARGGGIAQSVSSTAETTVTDTTFARNTTQGGSGASGGALAAAGALTARRVRATENTATGGQARGGAFIAKSASLIDATFTRNRAYGGRGAIFCGGFCGTICQDTPSSPAFGGAVWTSGDLTVQGGQFSANEARAGQPGCVTPVPQTPWCPTPPVPLPPICGSTGPAWGGAIASNGKTTIEGGAYTGNVGGAIYSALDLRLVSASVLGNTGEAISTPANAEVERSSIKDNSAFGLSAFGQLRISETEVTGNGGGVNAASAQVRAVTIANNRGPGLQGIADFSLVNSTVSENSVAFSLRGALSLDSVTVADNATTFSVQGPIRSHRSAVIAAGPICAWGTRLESSSYSWFSDTSCALSGPGDQQGAAPFLLAPLADNGGPVPTRLPAAGSALVDRIPIASCGSNVDQRGTVRPQGVACDIGAVEAAPIAGTGSSDLRLAFINSPASVTPGEGGTWQLSLTNRGPNGSAPAVVVRVPDGVTLTSITATQGGTCSSSDPSVHTCVWNTAFANGATATISIAAAVKAEAISSLVWQADVVAPGLLPPLEDDRAQLITPLSARVGIVMQAAFNDNYAEDAGVWLPLIAVSVRNTGPSNITGTTAQPIEAVFHPAPGVHVKAFGSGNRIVGSFAPSEAPFAKMFFSLSFDQGVPAELGTLELRPGITAVPGLQPLTVVAADIEVSASRSAAPTAPGAAVEFSIDVTNKRGGTAREIRVALPGPRQFYATPSQGALQTDPASGQAIWLIPSLAPGQKVSLTGTASGELSGSGTVSVTSQTIDLNGTNDAVYVDTAAAPLGGADVRIVSVEQRPSSRATEHILRVTVTNQGPAAAEELVVSVWGVNVYTVDGPDDWYCATPNLSPDCQTQRALAVSQTLTFDFIVEPPLLFSAPPDSVSATVYSSTPDPVPADNRRYTEVPFGQGLGGA